MKIEVGKTIELVIVSMSNERYKEDIDHSYCYNISDVVDIDEKPLTDFTKHVIKIDAGKPFDIEMGMTPITVPEGGVKEIKITWYWDKKLPFNFKHYDRKVLTLEDVVPCGWTWVLNGYGYFCVEDLLNTKNKPMWELV